MTTRCKFYITNINQTGGNNEPWCNVHFSAVYSPDEKKEEFSFWKASPNGNLKMYLTKSKMEEMGLDKCGQKFYIDIAPLETESEVYWRLSMLGRPGPGSLSIKLDREPFNWDNGYGGCYFEVTIDNQIVWEMFKNLDDKYSLEIIPAD